MKRLCNIALAAGLLTSPLRAGAIEWHSAEAFHLASNDTVAAQTLLYAASARIDGESLDDLFILAADTAFNGSAAADAWFLGNTIAIPGRIAGHTRALARTLTISGALDRDLTAIASIVRITTNVAVGGVVDLMAEQASLEGSFHGPVRLLARSVTLAGAYAETVRVIAEDIVVLPGTRIAGDLVYTSPKELFLDKSVLLGGALRRSAPTNQPEGTWQDQLQLFSMQSARALAAMLCGMALLAFFPRLTARAVRHVQRAPLRCALGGLAAIMLLPIAAFLMALTLVGIPLALLVAGLWLAGLYLSKIIVALWIGHLLLRRPGPHTFGRTALRLLVGLTVLYAVTLLPLIGGSLALLIGIYGFGALLFAVVRGDERRVQPPSLPIEPGGSI